MLSIVIVNWNACDLILKLLNSLRLARQNFPWPLEVVVVDNASSDGSVDRIKHEAPDITLICSETNRGFAGGCNLGAHYTRFPYILFLNPDTEVEGSALARAVEFLKQEGQLQTGIVGIQLINEHSQVARSSARFPRATMFLAQNLGLDRIMPQLGHTMREWNHGETRVVDQVIGAFFLVRRSLFYLLNGFDERFFVYFEEVDFSYRAKRLGFRSVYLADVRAFHKGEGTTTQIRGRRLFYLLRSRLIYGLKHYKMWENILNFVNTLLIEPVSRSAFLIISGRYREIPELVEAFSLLYFSLPSLVIQRSKK